MSMLRDTGIARLMQEEVYIYICCMFTHTHTHTHTNTQGNKKNAKTKKHENQ